MNLPLEDAVAKNHSGAEFNKPFQHRTTALCSEITQKADWALSSAEFPSRESQPPETEWMMTMTSKSAKSDRYKTELCRQFSENGVCRYGDKCQFAHGAQELRPVNRHPKYKTNLCRTFHSTGFCPYGTRCHFIHGEMMSPVDQKLNTRSKAMSSSSSAAKLNQSPSDLNGIDASPYESLMHDELDRMIRGIQGLMNRSIIDSSHLIHDQRTIDSPMQPKQLLLYSKHSAASPFSRSWSSDFNSTDLLGSTSVSPTLSCSDSPNPSPTSNLHDVDIWTSLANIIGVRI